MVLTTFSETVPRRPTSTTTRDKNHTDMLYLMMYDIADNKVRREISKYLQKKGCYRIQKSVFLAQLPTKVYEEICYDLKEVQAMYENEDSILLIPLGKGEFEQLKMIGQQLDLDLMSGNKNTLFF